MRRSHRQLPGTWLVVVLLAAAIGWTAMLRAGRVVAGSLADKTTHGDATWPDMRIDVNSAPATRLEVLPGVGPRLAQRIVADRVERGPFASVDDLDRVTGVGPAIVRRVRPFAVADQKMTPGVFSSRNE
jgi:competence protein ComEA